MQLIHLVNPLNSFAETIDSTSFNHILNFAAMIDFDAENITLDHNERSRYARHLCLPEVGVEGQKRLKAASVLCVGTGGLGSPILLYLAAAGIGKIGIVDFDVVDESNLQRQIIHATSKVGLPKTMSAKNSILEINPYCDLQIHNSALTSDNALDIIKDYDIVCDGTDNFPARYLINDACVILGKPNVYGSIIRFEGHATVFNLDERSPNYRDLFPPNNTVEVKIQKYSNSKSWFYPSVKKKDYLFKELTNIPQLPFSRGYELTLMNEKKP